MDWRVYEALIKQGYNKEDATRIANGKPNGRTRSQSKKSRKRRGVR